MRHIGRRRGIYLGDIATVSAIYGIFGEGDIEEVRSMGRRLGHRGSAGTEWSVDPMIHFGQRARGHHAAAFVPPAHPIAFAGFLNNQDELASLIERRQADGPGDTEASLVFEIFRKFGPNGFRYINGQFAVAIWDAHRSKLILARDRWDACPLYFTHITGRYLFASEYKALLAVEQVPARPNRNAIQYTQYTKNPLVSACFLADVHPVLEGSWLALGESPPLGRRYWDIKISIDRRRSVEDHATNLRTVLLDAVRRQTVGYDKSRGCIKRRAGCGGHCGWDQACRT